MTEIIEKRPDGTSRRYEFLNEEGPCDEKDATDVLTSVLNENGNFVAAQMQPIDEWREDQR